MSLFHFHKWQAEAVIPMVQTARGYFLGGVYMPYPEPKISQVTEVLYSCKCGLHKTESLIGHWTMENLAAGSK